MLQSVSEEGKQVSSRKDVDGQSAVIKIFELRDKLDYLVKLFGAAQVAKDIYGDAVKAIAEKAGLQASTVRKFIAAKAGDNLEDKRHDAQQLALVFDEIE